MLLHSARIFDGYQLISSEYAILLEGQTIAAVQPLAEFAAYAGHRVNLQGKTILPGLIDCHAHLVLSGYADVWTPLLQSTQAKLTLNALKNAQDCLRGGVTSLRDCGGVFHIEFAVRDLCNSGAELGPTIRAAGKFICMCGGANHLVARVADGIDDIRKAVREQVHAGSDFIKLMATGSVLSPGSRIDEVQYREEELLAGTDEAKRLGRYVAAHAIGTQGILNAVRAGARSIEHGMFLTPECIDEMLRCGTYLVPTLGAVARILEHRSELPQAVVAKAESVNERHQASVKAFADAGGLIAMGGDTGTPYNPHGENALELLHMVKAGMSTQSALVAATTRAAELMGLTDRGQLKAGYQADIVIVQGDPTQDINCVAYQANHVAVFKDGKLVNKQHQSGIQSACQQFAIDGCVAEALL